MATEKSQIQDEESRPAQEDKQQNEIVDSKQNDDKKALRLSLRIFTIFVMCSPIVYNYKWYGWFDLILTIALMIPLQVLIYYMCMAIDKILTSLWNRWMSPQDGART